VEAVQLVSRQTNAIRVINKLKNDTVKNDTVKETQAVNALWEVPHTSTSVFLVNVYLKLDPLIYDLV
jgi:hypothetical protein